MISKKYHSQYEKYQEMLKRHSYMMQYSENAGPDEWREIDEYRIELKLAEKDVIIADYRIKLGDALNAIEDLEAEVKELQKKLKSKENK